MSDRSTDNNGTRASQGKYAKRNANRTKQTRRLPHKEFMGTEIRYGSMPQRVIDAWFDGDFNDKKYKLLSMICCHAPSFHIKFSYLRKRMCPKTVKKFLKELVDEGYVRIESVKMPGGGSETVYHTTELTHWKVYEDFEFADIRDQFEGSENEGSLSTPRQPITSSPVNLRQPAEVGLHPLRDSIPVRHQAEVGAAAVWLRPPVNQTNITTKGVGTLPGDSLGSEDIDVQTDSKFNSFLKGNKDKRAEATQRAEDEITELQKNCGKDYGATDKKPVTDRKALYNEFKPYFTGDGNYFNFQLIYKCVDMAMTNRTVDKLRDHLTRYCDKVTASAFCEQHGINHDKYVEDTFRTLLTVKVKAQPEPEPIPEVSAEERKRRIEKFKEMKIKLRRIKS